MVSAGVLSSADGDALSCPDIECLCIFLKMNPFDELKVAETSDLIFIQENGALEVDYKKQEFSPSVVWGMFLTELGITEGHFKEMADHACGGKVIPEPKALTSEDIVNIYKMCL